MNVFTPVSVRKFTSELLNDHVRVGAVLAISQPYEHASGIATATTGSTAAGG